MSDFKKLFSLFLIALFFTVNLHSEGFNAIFSKDGIDVIAAGKSGIYFRSYDGGINWGPYTLDSNDFNSVYVINQSIWLAGNNGAFYYSTNNGSAWSSQTLAGGLNLKSVFFINANTGWIAGANGTILYTTNGGANWTAQSSTLSTDINSIKFSTTVTGAACGNGGKVVRTTNGGTTWTQMTTGVNNDLLSIDYKGATIIATAADGFILRYYALSWTNIDYKIDTKSSVNSVFMLDSTTTFYTCGGGGFIRKTTNGGTTFTYQNNPMLANLVNIYFYNSNLGWAVSSLNNAIIRTNDGGNTWSLPANTTVSYSWTLKQSGTSNIGNGFCLHPKNKNGIFIMMGNSLYRSLDKGETWTLIGTNSLGGSAHSFFVNSIDTNLMIASKGSSGGRMTRSTDYGQTWTDILGSINLTSYGMPLEVDQNNPMVCYLGPDNSVLKKSTNFGLTFVDIGLTTFRSPCDFAVVYGNSNIMYCGDGTTGSGAGEFFKSTNGGVNWTSLHTVTGSEIPMVAITAHDSNFVFHTTWSSGGVWRSTDQGSNFTQPAGTSNCWAADVAKDDPNVIVYGTYGSTVYISTDGGTNFTSTTVPSSPEAGILVYDRGNIFAQHGGGVYKLGVTYTVVTGITHNTGNTPDKFALRQNYPNPFNPSTVIKYSVSKSSNVKIVVYDMLGSEVKTLVNGEKSPGNYDYSFNASGLSSGVYFYSMFSDGVKIDTKKMLLIK
jgi:photosystem II stability/assembly factor-like uncharacterized protein